MHDVAALYREFDPLRPITAQETDLYVDWQRELYPAGQDPSSRLIRGFQEGATPERPITLLLAGQSGAGKTTELSRIGNRLTHGEHGRRVFVSTLRGQEFLDLEDVHPEDLVLQMVRQLAADLSAAGMDLCGFGITAVLRSVSELVMSSRSDGAGHQRDPLLVGFTRKEVSTGRDEYRARWREQLPTVFDHVNGELLPAARDYLEKDGYDDLLLIVDDLDRIPRKVLAEDGRTNHENLFLPRTSGSASESISPLGLGCSLLLTVPLELTFGAASEQMRRVYGGSPHRVPCVPITDRSGQPIDGADTVLVEILRRRAVRAGLDAALLFDDSELLRRVVRLSGGNIRGLLAMMTGLLDRVDDLPIASDTVNRFVASRAAALVRALLSSHRGILQRLEHGAAAIDDPRFFDLLRYRDIFVYEDAAGDAWYGLNPVLQEMAV